MKTGQDFLYFHKSLNVGKSISSDTITIWIGIFRH